DARTMAAAGADGIVAQGGEAGGHRSVDGKPASPESASVGTIVLVPQVVEAVRVPVVAAGGIADGRGLVAALALGASGILLGTRFVATRESMAAEIYKKRVLESDSTATTLTDTISGLWARALRNRFTEEYRASGSPVKLDCYMPTHDLKSVPAYSRKVEALGFDCLWTAETQHDPFLPLAIAATATTRLKLGTAIAVAFPRSPMITAHIAWDLQKASDGRFCLGLGSQIKGHNERRFSVKFESPGPRLREVVLALRTIWDCWQNRTKLNFAGQFYRFDLMTPFFDPGPIEHPTIPIYIAGVNRLMCRIAGEVCDGLHVHPFNSPKYLREYVQPAVEEGLAAGRRQRHEFSYVTSTFTIVGDTEQERADAREAVRQQIAFYASTRTYEPVLASHGRPAPAQ